jgi:CRP-like cAMP-binding protein
MSSRERIAGETLLASISIFEGLAPEVLELLLGITQMRELEAGEVLFRKGDPGDQLYGVMEGRLRVSGAGEDGEEVAFGVLDPGEVFGEIALLDSSPRSASVESLEPTRLLSLHREDFLPFLDQHPQVAVRLAAMLAERLRKLSSLLEDTLFLTLPSRVAMNLVALAQAVGGETPDGVSFDISLPRTQLAELAGRTPENLAEQLREWEARGLLQVEHGVITVSSLEGLESLARFLVL